eukprot:12898003-Prorocentrum_lima.AAC.1
MKGNKFLPQNNQWDNCTSSSSSTRWRSWKITTMIPVAQAPHLNPIPTRHRLVIPSREETPTLGRA